MTGDTFRIEFIGGSRDAEIADAVSAPDYIEVSVGTDETEIYERQNTEPPFAYVQIGYAKKEDWNNRQSGE
jgi:hypothetical protein